MKILVAFAALLLAACEAAPPTAPPEAPVQYPALTGRVVDAANLLSPEQERYLTTHLDALEGEMSDQLVIVTIPSLGGRHIEDYARDLGNHWGVGQRTRDNGVLLVVAPNERKVRIAVGRGLEQVLTDAEAQVIIERDLLPAFRESDYFRGIDTGTRGITAQLASRESPAAAGSRR